MTNHGDNAKTMACEERKRAIDNGMVCVKKGRKKRRREEKQHPEECETELI